MPGSRRAGGVTKRCECREGGARNGKRLGDDCPQLAKPSHGTYQVAQELPPTTEGKRRQWRRTGYAKVKDASADLARVQSILDLGKNDTDAQVRLGDFLAEIARDRADLPEPAAVAQKLGVGVPLDGKMTIGQWLDRWIAAKKTRNTTNNAYRSHIEYHLKPRIGHLRLDRLNVGHLDEMFTAILDANDTITAENAERRAQEERCRWTKPGRPPAAHRAGLAAERAKLAAMPPYRKTNDAATRQAIRRTLRTALNAAIARQLITFNAASFVELPSGKRPKARLWTEQHVARWRETGERPSAVMVWTPRQIGEFLDAAEGQRLYPLYHLIAFRGLRRGEAVGQGWVNVDLDGEAITIVTSITVDGWTMVEDAPKTEDSAATIALGPLTAEVLRQHKARQAEEKKAAGDKWVETGKVFTTETGEWLHPQTVSDVFDAIVAKAGLPPINLRDLRHCAATLIHAGGGDLHAIKEVLRHSTITLTSDTYTSLLKEVDQEIAAKSELLVPRARRPVVAVPDSVS